MKRVLIISPHFPPVNAADMQRVRQTLPYLLKNGWEAEVITVDPSHIETYSLDELLLHSVPKEIKVHYIKAWDIKKTRKFGLGSLSMRSFFHFKKAGNHLLSQKRFDLVYFSTTAFHVMALGPYWKRRFKVPFVVDIQDPWRNDFYLDKPSHERPPKFFISYNIDKYLESITIPEADGVVSVSEGYCRMFSERYRKFSPGKCVVIPFGWMKMDVVIMEEYLTKKPIVDFDPAKKNIVYIGRGGHDMKFALQCFFRALKSGADKRPELFRNLHCWFIGTSYAMPGKGTPTIKPVADKLEFSSITELTDRLPYFEALQLLKKADILFIPGSTDINYTASKVYPYVSAGKPLISVFHQNSSVGLFLKETNAGICIQFSEEDESLIAEKVFQALENILSDPKPPQVDWKAFEEYSAENLTRRQVDFFNEVIARYETAHA